MFIMKLKYAFSVFALIAATIIPSLAEARMERLGTVRLTWGRQTDILNIRSCAENREEVRAIQLRVVGGPANIDSVVVQFGNGERQRLRVRENFRAGQRSRWIRLGREARCVRRIWVTGSGAFVPFLFNTRVQIWGDVERMGRPDRDHR